MLQAVSALFSWSLHHPITVLGLVFFVSSGQRKPCGCWHPGNFADGCGGFEFPLCAAFPHSLWLIPHICGQFGILYYDFHEGRLYVDLPTSCTASNFE